MALLLSDVVFWIFHIKQLISGRHDASDGIERYIMDFTKDSSRAMGFDVWDGDDEVIY